jgi:hypothetical protein
MKRLAAGMLALITMSGARSGAQEVPPPEGFPKQSCRDAIVTQNRINTYFHRGVVPRMMTCWNRLTSPGTVSVTFEFARKGDLWVPGASYLRSTTPANPPDADLALSCLQAAVVGTAFPVDETDLGATQFGVHWSFPVPWPRDLNGALARFNTNNPSAGQCGGSEGPPPACEGCFWQRTFGFSYCAKACVGWVGCTDDGTLTGCRMTNPKCVTGSAFGNSAGLTIY